jgi:hypothetical protein
MLAVARATRSNLPRPDDETPLVEADKNLLGSVFGALGEEPEVDDPISRREWAASSTSRRARRRSSFPAISPPAPNSKSATAR